VHWARGGPTNRDNLVLLCAFHHRLVHEGGFDIRRHDGGVVFLRPDGSPVPVVPVSPPGDPAAVPRETGAAGIAIDPGTCVTKWDGQSLDLGYAVSVLLDRHRRAA
jgi:hypothetical protein